MAQAGATALAVNSQGSVRAAATADWKVQGAMSKNGQGKGTGGSGHGGDGSWKAQGSGGGGSGWDSVVVCTTPAVTGTAVVEAGTQGFGRGFARGGGNMK